MLSCFKDLSLSFGFVWKESLWEDFWTLWGWVCLSCLVAPGQGFLEPGLPPLWCGVGNLGAPKKRAKSQQALKYTGTEGQASDVLSSYAEIDMYRIINASILECPNL